MHYQQNVRKQQSKTFMYCFAVTSTGVRCAKQLAPAWAALPYYFVLARDDSLIAPVV